METAAGNARVRALDGWRGLAILLVLVGHFLPYEPYNLGTLGVELFFVLSGRLMAEILFVRKIEIGTFFFRRASRILPALTFFVVVLWLALELAGPPHALSVLWVAASLTFTENYVSVFTHPTGWLDHIWSLCVEEHSYLLLGLIACVFGRRMGASVTAVSIVALMAIAIGAVNSWVQHMPYETVYTRSDVHIASIFIAVVVYLLIRHAAPQALVQKYATPVFILALIGGAAMHPEAVPMPITYSIGTLCFAVAVALADVVARPLVAALSASALTQLGLWSYSIYLWQQPFYKLDEWGLLPGMRLWLVLAAIGCGVVSYMLVEKPSRAWLNGVWARRRKVAGALAAAPELVAEIAIPTINDLNTVK